MQKYIHITDLNGYPLKTEYSYKLGTTVSGDKSFKLYKVTIGYNRKNNISLASERDYVIWCKSLKKLIGGIIYEYNSDIIKNR